MGLETVGMWHRGLGGVIGQKRGVWGWKVCRSVPCSLKVVHMEVGVIVLAEACMILNAHRLSGLFCLEILSTPEASGH